MQDRSLRRRPPWLSEGQPGTTPPWPVAGSRRHQNSRRPSGSFSPLRRLRQCLFGVPPFLLLATALAAQEASPADDVQKRFAEQDRRIAELEKKLSEATAPAKAEKPGFLSALGSRLTMYGFLRVDAIYDDSRPNNTQTIAFIRSEDPNAPPSIGNAKNADDFTVHPRLSRFGIDFDGEEPAQEVRDFKLEAPVAHRLEKDSEGNRVAYLEAANPAPGELTLVETFTVTRREVRTDVDPRKAQPVTEEVRARFKRYLEPNQHIIIDDRIRKLADEIAGKETNPVIAARKLYDWVLENIDYWVKDPKNKKASPVGSSSYCLDNRTGNCTDFHSLWAALARARGIPTRVIYGSFFKKELNGQDVDASYHCWPEFYAPGLGWIPHDVAVADVFAGTFPVDAANETLVRRTTAEGYAGPDPKKVDYYFGNLDERRVVFSSGRDLKLNPPQGAGPVNALPKAYLEVDGQPLAEGTAWKRKLTYREKVEPAAGGN